MYWAGNQHAASLGQVFFLPNPLYCLEAAGSQGKDGEALPPLPPPPEQHQALQAQPPEPELPPGPEVHAAPRAGTAPGVWEWRGSGGTGQGEGRKALVVGLGAPYGAGPTCMVCAAALMLVPIDTADEGSDRRIKHRMPQALLQLCCWLRWCPLPPVLLARVMRHSEPPHS